MVAVSDPDTRQAPVRPVVYIQEIHNAFPCNIASFKHAGSWENTSSVG